MAADPTMQNSQTLATKLAAALAQMESDSDNWATLTAPQQQVAIRNAVRLVALLTRHALGMTGTAGAV